MTVYFEFRNSRGAIQGSEAGASKGLDCGSQASLVAVLFVASAAQAAFLVRGLP